MNDFITQAIQSAEQSKRQFIHSLSFVPKDKENWSPSPTAKSALKIAAHTAVSLGFFADIIAKRTSMQISEDNMKSGDAAEAEITSMSQAIKLLEEGTEKAITAMKALKPEDLTKEIKFPMSEKPFPLGFFATLITRHFDMHGGQIDYLQTVWGDQEMHFLKD